MERQSMPICIIVLGLFLTSRGLVFADSSSALRQPLRDKLAQVARSFLGLPYRWGGISERRGVDCSGLVKLIFAKLRINLPRTARAQIQSGVEVPLDGLKTGDLVFFSSDGNTVSHVGLYIGNHKFLHAEKKAGRVIITDMNKPWYAKRFWGARRVVDLANGGK